MVESQQTNSPAQQQDEVDFLELFRVFWRAKWLIGGITTVSTVIAVIIALMLPDIYRSEALLAPNDQESSGSLSALAAQYGGLASLAGINLGAGKADQTGLGLKVLQSRKFVSDFVQRHDLLVPLMAADGWDWETDELQIDEDDYDVKTGKWIRDVDPPRKVIPSMQEAYEEFIDRLTVTQNDETGFVTVSFDHYSPNIARQWVEWLVEDINDTIMRHDVTEAEEAITYLTHQIENTSLADLQSVFFALIEEQTKIVMLAKVSDEYLLQTLDPPVAPELKHRPRRSLIVILAMFCSGALAFLGVLIHNAIRDDAG